MKMISWNVNGLRAVLKKGFYESIAALDADVICLQEIKMQKGQCEVALPGYDLILNCADRKGYSGTAIFTGWESRAVKVVVTGTITRFPGSSGAAMLLHQYIGTTLN